MRIKIARKEARESGLWLRLLAPGNPAHSEKLLRLNQEARELTLILSAILAKSSPAKPD
jgi:hypothetical protein